MHQDKRTGLLMYRRVRAQGRGGGGGKAFGIEPDPGGGPTVTILFLETSNPTPFAHHSLRSPLRLLLQPVPANGLPGGVRVLPDLGDLISGEELPPFFKLLQGGGGRRRAAGSAAPDRRLCGDGSGGGGQWQAGPPVCGSPWSRWCDRSGSTSRRRWSGRCASGRETGGAGPDHLRRPCEARPVTPPQPPAAACSSEPRALLAPATQAAAWAATAGCERFTHRCGFAAACSEIAGGAALSGPFCVLGVAREL